MRRIAVLPITLLTAASGGCSDSTDSDGTNGTKPRLGRKRRR